MGKITSESQPETTNHFSHPHPLKLIINHLPQLTPNPITSCAGCNFPPSGSIYTCTIYPNYFLHKKCYEMPKKITHPFHKAHPFTLQPKSTYPGGLFNCDACGQDGDGFCYHCKPCGVDLHILCAATPLTVMHAFHGHKLDLTFENPYGIKEFCCAICKTNGSHWLYRCNLCGFDAHLKCATAAAPSTNFTSQVRSAPLPPQQGFGPHFMAETQQKTYVIPPSPMMSNVATGFPATPSFGMGNNELATIQAFQLIINNNAAMAEAIRARGVAGGFGGNGGMQLLMQLISGGIGGGGSGGMQQVMQLIGGGIGGGLNGFDGGSGEQDLVQALMNGGRGGGGMDFSQLLGGGDVLGLLGGFGF